MSRPVLSLFLIASLLAISASADVYKYDYVDEHGKPQVVYTDKPELLPAEIMARIKSQRTDKSAVADRAATEQQQNDVNNANQASAADKKKAQQSAAADKADRCAKARERYDQLMTAQQLYSQDEKGERTYMDDKQMEQARTSAKQLMDTWCN